MKPSSWRCGFSIALALAGVGCQCPDYVFVPGEPYRLTVVESVPAPSNPDFPPCSDSLSSRLPSLMAGDSFEVVGTFGPDEGPWCNDAGGVSAKSETPAWFAPDLLSTCGGNSCSGTTATGCRREAGFYVRQNGAQWIFDIYWHNTCGDFPRCAESYAVTYTELASEADGGALRD